MCTGLQNALLSSGGCLTIPLFEISRCFTLFEERLRQSGSFHTRRREKDVKCKQMTAHAAVSRKPPPSLVNDGICIQSLNYSTCTVAPFGLVTVKVRAPLHCIRTKPSQRTKTTLCVTIV